MDFVAQYYLYFKALHIIAVISWMAAMLYLPRLYVYHATAESGGRVSETFKIMEGRLLRYIMTPAMLATFLFGLLMLMANSGLMQQGWMHAKLLLVFGMAGAHGYLAKIRKDFLHDRNTRPAKFYRILNEVPTLLMIVIVILAVAKPF